MTSIFSIITYPILAGYRAIFDNIRLWRKTFWETWEPLSWDDKFAWIAFISQTIAILTLIELFLLKR
jgi:hypothetical protein